MEITGVVESIVYRNEENGYTVAKLQTDSRMITVVGKFLTISVGENVLLTGQESHNSRYGLQFEFDKYEIVYPTTLAGIERYLGSGLIKGVGPVTAKAIVNQFGTQTLEIIEFFPSRLAQVKGVSEKKAQTIGESFQQIKKMQSAVMFLQNYNISINMALKIYEAYQEKTVEIVRENPYKLVEDIDGIGFLTADNIAKNMGINPKSAFRVRAGLLHVLADSGEKTGNTFNYKNTIFSQGAKLLGLDDKQNEQLFEKVIEQLVAEKVVVEFYHEKRQVLMLSKYYFLEKSVAQKLALLKAMSKQRNIDVDQDIKTFEMLNGLTFHAEQKNAIKMAVNSGVSVITGGPGTGKTTIVKCIIELLGQMKSKILLVAPTGRAAKRLNESTGFAASTIHRALELDFRAQGTFLHNEHNPLDVDVVIVDEVSMVDIALANALLKALPRDCRLVLVGDKDQLPSVGAGNVLHDILASGMFDVVHLTKIYRQEDKSMIVSNAHLINSGQMPVLDNSSKDFFFEQKANPVDAAQSILELVTTRITNFTGKESTSIQVLCPLKLGLCGTNALNFELQSKLNPESLHKAELVFGNTIFREGDKVMHIANNYNLSWTRKIGYLIEQGMGVFNGDIGYIHKIDRQTGETTVWFEDGRECVYPRSEVSQLTLAYAITVHKSQGSEFDVVVIPVISGPKMILTRNLLYTAVTRAKNMVVLVGEKAALRRMISNNYTALRLTMLETFLKQYGKEVNIMFGE